MLIPLAQHGCQPSRYWRSKQDPGSDSGGARQREKAINAEPVHEQPRSKHPSVLQTQFEGGEGQRGAAAHRRPAEGRSAARPRPLLRLLHHSGLLVWEPHPPGAPTARP